MLLSKVICVVARTGDPASERGGAARQLRGGVGATRGGGQGEAHKGGGGVMCARTNA